MRTLAKCLVFLVLAFIAPGSLAYGQDKRPTDIPGDSTPRGATKEEVEQLRREVAAQRETIEALKAMVQRLVEVSQPGAGVPRLVEVSAVQPENIARPAKITQPDKQAAQKKGSDAGPQTGWNGEHFFLKSVDGNFLIQPYGYVQMDYRAYNGTSAPTNTFAIRRGRFGFQGTLGKHYEFALLAEFADTNNVTLRDFYLNVKPVPELQFQFGQFKEPFAQEEMTGAAYLDFVERSLASLLYPSATSFRSPGAMVHGDLIGGAVQYWAGAFNGKGTLNLNDTSTPEGVARLRFYPLRHTSNEWFKGFAFGGAFVYGRSLKGSSVSGNSVSGLLPTRTFTFFKSDPINGGVVRANGEMTWVKGPMAIRAEYDQTNQNRTHITATGAASTTNLPGVVAKGYYATTTYLLTGEKRPENGQPTPRHSFLGKDGRGFGAWELKFRYSNLQIEDGTQRNRVDQFSTGVNWYPTSLVRYMLDFNVERLKNPFPNPGTPTLLPQRFLSILQRVQIRF